MNLFSSLLRYLDIRLSHALRKPPATLPILLLWVTDRCNLRCAMCGDQWRSELKHNQPLLTLAEIEKIIEAAARLKTMVISLTGGEPLLRPDIFQILELIGQHGLAANICSNGTLLTPEKVERLADSPLYSISISIDHNQDELHDRIRGKKGAFAATVDGIKLLRAARPDLWININCTITRENYRIMPEMVRLTGELGCNKISFGPIHTNLQHQMRPEPEFNGLIFTTDDLADLKRCLEESRVQAARRGIRTSSATFMKNIPRFYQDPVRWHTCYAGYGSCAISPWGDVSPCVDMESHLNVRSKSLDEIWTSTEFQELRNKVDLCTNPCWDTTNAEIAIRFTTAGLFGELMTLLREYKTYSSLK